jgi:hypothetical protein
MEPRRPSAVTTVLNPSPLIRKKQLLSLDIAGGYPDTASVKSWKRFYQLTPDGGLNILENFVIKEAKATNQINILVWQKPAIPRPGAH